LPNSPPPPLRLQASDSLQSAIDDLLQQEEDFLHWLLYGTNTTIRKWNQPAQRAGVEFVQSVVDEMGYRTRAVESNAGSSAATAAGS
jgi:hypothetical protein